MRNFFALLGVIVVVFTIPSFVQGIDPFSAASERAKDARITADMAQLQAVAEIYSDAHPAYDETGKKSFSYVGIKDSADIETIKNDINSQGSMLEWGKVTDRSYAAWAPLTAIEAAGRAWCVDSKGNSRNIPHDAVIEGETEVCPASDAPPIKSKVQSEPKKDEKGDVAPVILGVIIFLEIIAAAIAFFILIRRKNYPHE